MKTKFLFLTMALSLYALPAQASFNGYYTCMANGASGATSMGNSYSFAVYPGSVPPTNIFTYCRGTPPYDCWNPGVACAMSPDSGSNEGNSNGPNPPPPPQSPGMCGSKIDIIARSVGESIPIVGTPFSLTYSSARGRRTYEYSSHTGLCETPSAGGSLPDCHVDVTIAGATLGQDYVGGSATNHDFAWNGLDSSSNRVYFSRVATITYTLLNLPSPNSSWALPITSTKRLGTFDTMFYGLGGWSLDVLHAYDSDAGVIYYGDGTAEALPAIVQSSGDLWVKSPSGEEVYVFSSAGRHLSTRSGMLGDVIYTFGYDSSGHLTSITDAYSNVTTINRSSGVLTGITSPYSMATTISLNSNGFIYQVTDPNSKVTTVTYADARGLIASFARPGVSATTFSHTADGLLISDANPTGRTLTYGFDTSTPPNITETTALGLASLFTPTASPDDYVNQTSASYLASGWTSSLSSSPGTSVSISDYDGTHTSNYSADSRNSVFSAVSSMFAQSPSNTLYRTDTYGQSYTLGTSGDIFSTTVAQFTHTVNSQTFETDYDNSTKTYTYTTPLSRTATATIDTHERLTQVAIPHLSAINFTYDSFGRPYTATQGSRSLTYGYDTHGFLNSITDALSHTTGYTYNNSGFLTLITLPDTRTIGFGYDDRGNVTSITDPKSHTTSFTWNAFDNQTQFYPPVLSGISAPQTDITYTTDQNIDTITRPDSQVIDYDYDASTGLLNSMTTTQGTTTIVMDAANRLSSAVLGDNTTSITRDGPMLMADSTTQLNAATTGYDTSVVAYGYNYQGQRTSVTIRDSSSTSVLSASLGYDYDGLLTTAGDETLGYNADNGLLETIDNGNVHVTITHNTNGDVDTYTAKYNTTTLYTYTLTYYNDGRIHTMNETIQGTTNNYSYTYDSAGRLSTVTKNSTLISSYTYDNNGNRTSGTKNSVSFSASYDAQDRMSTWNTYSFAYNANGETTSRTNSSTSVTTNYLYDTFGHMMEAYVTSGMDVVYMLDPTGRRIRRTSGGTETARYLYDGQYQVVGEVNSNNTMRKLFVYGSRSNVPDYYTDGTDDYQFFVDPLGSVRLVVKVATGSVDLRRDYDEFGIITNTSGSNTEPFGFAGGVYDSQTNFYHFGERDYDPETGHWLSKDPIQFKGGDTNLFGYVINDPVNKIDPSGKSSVILRGPAEGGTATGCDAASKCGQTLTLVSGAASCIGVMCAKVPTIIGKAGCGLGVSVYIGALKGGIILGCDAPSNCPVNGDPNEPTTTGP